MNEYIFRRREPLTASQHILHLLLSVFTAGLWLPVWFIRAIQGNVTAATGPASPPVPSSVYDPRFRHLSPDAIYRIMAPDQHQH